MAKGGNDTPLMQQHRSIKQKYPDAILLFRVGDFYETFGEDAIIASRVLGITLTKRNNGAASESELAGFPHHALDTYLHKLVKAGHRVAICDQLEDPKQAKGLVKRGVTEMVTPGIATHDKMLEHHSNHFLAGLFPGEQQEGIAFLDVSTGEFFLAEGNAEYIDKLLQSFQPAEVIFPRTYQKKFKEQYGQRFYTYTLDTWIFEKEFAYELLLKHFQTHSLKGFGVEEMNHAIIAAGAIMHYLRETAHPNLQHITQLQRLEKDDFLWMDRFTIRNLELLGNGQHESHHLLQVMDQTVSPMGARLLKRWMIFPLKDLDKIRERHLAVEWLLLHTDTRKKIIQTVKAAGDIERLVSKIPLKKINPRELLQVAKGLEMAMEIKQLSTQISDPYLQRIGDAIHECQQIKERIFAELEDLPPVQVQKGQVIRAGVHAELDELRNIVSGGKDYLVKIQQEEAEKTGIGSLKISYNQVFGYYLEVTNAHKSKVPDRWIRKQTLANAERYITPELKVYEEKITGAEEKILALETALYEKLLTALQDYIQPIQTNAHVLAVFDCLCCFAETALANKYTKPIMHDGLALQIEAARHPVIEKHLPSGETYIDNDILLDPISQQIIILTGPNMSGKSAILRQTALITLMAHMGSFVPAAKANIPLTDKIFTRVGASDNLSGGESTFMVEMNETASIINNISQRSLILLDEIGRGTSTYDGISIAWSIVEYLQSSPQQPKTLFATHYHELNELENLYPNIRNYHVTNREVGNKVIFLRKLAAGGSTHSFGIHVARMAGMPPSLIERANKILAQLESSREQSQNEGLSASITPQKSQLQLSIFDAHSLVFEEIRKTLSDIDINRLTPVEALLKLQEIKQKIQ